MKYTREVLAKAVRDSISMQDVMRRLGIVKPSGGMHAHLRRRIDKLGIDTSHFKGQGYNTGVVPNNRMPPEERLVRLPPGSNRPPGFRLKRALLEIGVRYACHGCDVGSEWQGKPLTLHVDHINGEFLDCRRENLRFLCPNCHSQTATFAGRSRNSWRGMQEQADVMARNRLIIETALRNPSMGANNLTKLHPAVARLCGMETVRRILKRVDLESVEARRDAAGVSLWAEGGVRPWAEPTLAAFRDRLTVVLVRRTEATTSGCADGALDSRMIGRHRLIHRSKWAFHSGY